MYIKRSCASVSKKIFETTLIDQLITGYLPRSIYAFNTKKIPNYLKVGDTNRKVETRLSEWRKIYKDLEKVFEYESMLEDKNGEKTVFFRDYSLHDYFLKSKNSKRFSNREFENEFFEYITTSDIEEGIEDIKKDYIKEGIRKYNFYEIASNNSQVESHWVRNQNYEPRPNQKIVINNIVNAVKGGKNNLLLYAVMRFGKSNVSIWSAKELDSKITIIVSGKADVKSEWKKTVESHVDFKNFIFTEVINFDEDFYRNNKSKNIVIFVTLQDLAGSQEEMKDKHKFLFELESDLMIIDETHFGARANIYGKSLESKEDIEFEELEKYDLYQAIKNINVLSTKVKLHLSGTPYRILLSGEFLEGDIVGKIQFNDILESKKEWINKNIEIADKMPWENPYFGFPEMIRFAFSPTKAALKMLEKLKVNGISAELNVLFEPESTAKNKARETKFKYESDVLDILKAIDGSKEDSNIFPLLDYHLIKNRRLGQHIVMVLPFKNSVDALERLLIEQKGDFHNLQNYEVLNIAGNTSRYKSVDEVQRVIRDFSLENKKTISLTVNKMLTGSTVPQWDTMIFLKDTKSPQEYDQAIYRLQSPWIKDIKDLNSGEVVGKEDMKPQTLLIDFSPNRIFKIESERALVVNASEGKTGNENQVLQLKRSISFSPIIQLNVNKLTEVTPQDIISKIRDYSSEKSIVDEVHELPIDEKLYLIPEILAEISKQAELGNKNGFELGISEEQDTYFEEPEEVKTSDSSEGASNEKNLDQRVDDKPSVKQMQMYYSRILFYSFLLPNDVKNLSDIILSIDTNKRLAKNLEIKKPIIVAMKKYINPFVLASLDNKIENINQLRFEAKEEGILKAISKFGRVSENEVFTPISLAKNMINDLMSDDFIQEFRKKPKNIFDMTSKSGVFLIIAYQKLVEAGIEENLLKKKLFAVATSPVSYEFTRVVYEEFGWDLNNLANCDSFNSYKLIEKDFSTNQLKNHFGDDNLKFDVIIGNPPYQEKAKGTSSSDDPIYHLFMKEAYKLANKVMFITPARFLFNAGKTPRAWNNEMLHDKHLSIRHYELTSEKVFPGTAIPGGVVVTYRDVDIDFGEIGTFVKFEHLDSILQKVWKLSDTSLRTIIYSQNKFDLESLYNDYPEFRNIIGNKGKDKRFRQIIMQRLNVFSDKKLNDDDLRILGLINKKRTYRYIPRKYVQIQPWVDAYKVFVPFSNGASGTLGDSAARLISTPVLGYPGEGMTQTFIGIGAYMSKEEGENLLLYVKSKFARVMLGILKVTQGNKPDTWEYVPLQDFTKSSDINWSKSSSEIDQQLYEKYGLSDEEIAFIEEKVAKIE